MWYVIQTSPGEENTVKAIIDNTIPREICEGCKILYYEVERKYQGKWHIEKKKLFPCYLFLVTDRIEELGVELKKFPQMTKLLGTGEEVLPVSSEEEAFLKRLAGESDNVEMSYGIQVGDEIIVNSGSLKGLESQIRKIDRHKRKAVIEMDLFGSKRLVEIGLEIVERR